VKYELNIIQNHRDGITTLYVKDKVFGKLADIPWKEGEQIKLFLNPANVGPIDGMEVSTGEHLPIFNVEELQIAINTVKAEAQKSRQKQPFNFR
jgi:hypothetical protein